MLCTFSTNKSSVRGKFGIVKLPFYKTCSSTRTAFKTVIEELGMSDQNHLLDFLLTSAFFCEMLHPRNAVDYTSCQLAVGSCEKICFASTHLMTLRTCFRDQVSSADGIAHQQKSFLPDSVPNFSRYISKRYRIQRITMS